MNGDQATRVTLLIERMTRGDTAARGEFLGHVYDRVHQMAGNILRSRFPRLRFDTESASVANRACTRLLGLQELSTATLDEFMRVCASTVEWVLLDIARKKKRRPADFAQVQIGTGNSNTSSLEALGEESAESFNAAEGIALLERISRLPDHLRSIVLQHGYLALPQSEIAQIMDMKPKEVSRLWNRAKEVLRAREET
jgi:DNA-directed RNA polymerase specialized sigma24 family protein